MLSDLALEVVGDCAIVWLLSPKAAFGAKPTGALASFYGSLPGYAFQVGAFRSPVHWPSGVGLRHDAATPARWIYAGMQPKR